jgi:hypothetical protein
MTINGNFDGTGTRLNLTLAAAEASAVTASAKERISVMKCVFYCCRPTGAGMSKPWCCSRETKLACVRNCTDCIASICRAIRHRFSPKPKAKTISVGPRSSSGRSEASSPVVLDVPTQQEMS